ncbi:hypothetical protein WMW72_10705 [Paenibacillus filicis]|uniref:Uncharacterized protein n=1 Tax=Paenibacillus filicis TaxID=669464 RepID=A0ABU9DJX9_9BACL
MDAKYVALLSKIQDRNVKFVLTEIINDMEKKAAIQPVDAIGKLMPLMARGPVGNDRNIRMIPD